MDLASLLLEHLKCLCGLANKPLGYVYNLKDNVDSLRKATEELKAKSDDVKARVELEEGGEDAKRTKEVEIWLGEVQKFEGGVDHVLREVGERDQIKCLSRCLPWNGWSSYKLGKRVYQMLNEVRELQTMKEKFGLLTLPLPPPPVLEMPMYNTVGLDISKLNQLWKWLVHEKQVRIIGLYGAGGVGKTTLMKRINDKLSCTNHGFDVVIWVVVSRQVNEDSIQDTIRKRLGIKNEHWEEWSWDERVHHLRRDLTHKKFVLLIDDLWGRLDLSKIGVPHPGENGSKVVFTTRSKQVCNQMKADKTFEVQCLTPKEALELFENSVGKSAVYSHLDIPQLAKDIVQECKGLPLALITVGQVMAGNTNPHEWRHALTTLRNNPHKLSGMVEEMYHILEFSYKSLNDSMQHCFLYCCLFLEDYPIRKDMLIGLWIGEDLLGDTDDVYRMRDEGESILGHLKRACLLESGHDDNGEEYVKMHDVIRDMAIWIARDHGQRENKLLVIENEDDMSAEKISKREEAEKVSLWGQQIRNIDQRPHTCSQLKILIIRSTSVNGVPSGFFDSMVARLTVLDLSDNQNIQLFPKEICNLINLRYLNLSNTCISELPGEIKSLTRLRWLLLDNMWGILIPTGAIASLPLNVLSMWPFTLVKEGEMLEELECMQHLTDLSFSVIMSSSTQKIFQSPNLRRCIRRVGIADIQNDLTSIVISYSSAGNDIFLHLEVIILGECGALVKIEISQGIGRAPNCPCFPSLIEVRVLECGLFDLSWLVHAPKLRKLLVGGCGSMEKIIGDGITREELTASGLFSRLEVLLLDALPNLKGIHDGTLLFPPGVAFSITDCPLIKLPLDSISASGSFSIFGDTSLWARLEWDHAARVTFQANGEGPFEEMTYGEAVRKQKDESLDGALIRFGP